MLHRQVLLPVQRLELLPPLARLQRLLRRALPRIEEGVGEHKLLLGGVGSGGPVLGADEPALEEVGVEGVELVDEALVNLGALPAGVEVLERLEDAPLVSAWGADYLIMK